MTPECKRTAAGSDKDDRLSNLPRNIIDCILELLPVKDAARTSILSRKWRCIWAMLPYLVLDECFRKKLSSKKKSVFKATIDQILFQHIGDIVKFVLDVPRAHLSSDTDIDRWMLYVTRHGVKELTLNMSNNCTYKLPSYIFNCPTLTHLRLSNCVFKPPNSFLSFQNLKSLCLEKITFAPTTESCIIQAPLLVELIMWFCNGFDRSTLEKLLLSLPRLETLLLSSLQLLSADTVPKELPFTLHSVWLLYLIVDLGVLGQTSGAVELIKCSPNLSGLEISVNGTNNNAEAVLEYLDRPACLDRPLNKLEVVTVSQFKGSKAELHFVKLLCARSPSLLMMEIKQSDFSSSSMQERNNIITELMRFPRASPKAELIYLPNEN